MEELKLLIEMVSNLPSLAVWVLIGYLVYKIVIIGSVYCVIRLAIVKLHSWATRSIEYKIDDSAINEYVAKQLKAQIGRLGSGSSYGYIHGDDVALLKRALDAELSKADAGKK